MRDAPGAGHRAARAALNLQIAKLRGRARFQVFFARYQGGWADRKAAPEFNGNLMIDLFKSHARTLTSPPEHAIEIMPSDLEEQSHITRALYVGGSGDMVVRLKDDVIVTLANVPAGTFLPLRIQQVLATGTTATSIVGFW